MFQFVSLTLFLSPSFAETPHVQTVAQLIKKRGIDMGETEGVFLQPDGTKTSVTVHQWGFGVETPCGGTVAPLGYAILVQESSLPELNAILVSPLTKKGVPKLMLLDEGPDGDIDSLSAEEASRGIFPQGIYDTILACFVASAG